ncbi:MAG: DegT/DnrJ/EryC1/StrS family aminotransferase [bacterium]
MIPISEPLLGEEELQNVIDAVKSGWISSKGAYITEFEQKFAGYCGVNNGIATSNGTAALHLALKALGIKKDDEVIVPTLTFIATANAVTYCNAKPVFVDSHPIYWNMDPEKIEEKITENTKAIIPVHLYGHPCDMDPIMDIARDHDLYVIEDAAEAHGAEYKGKKVGSFGDINCFSFYGNKIITTGEGGMCLTDDDELAERMRILRDHGMNPNRKYWHDVIGFNYRMTNMQAALGVAQIEKIEKIIELKRLNAEHYNRLLKNVNENTITLPIEEKWARNVYWMYSVLIDHRINRDDMIKKLEQEGIDTRPLFYPIHKMPPYLGGVFPVAEVVSKLGISLPSSPNLMLSEIARVCDVLFNIMSE